MIPTTIAGESFLKFLENGGREKWGYEKIRSGDEVVVTCWVTRSGFGTATGRGRLGRLWLKRVVLRLRQNPKTEKCSCALRRGRSDRTEILRKGKGQLVLLQVNRGDINDDGLQQHALLKRNKDIESTGVSFFVVLLLFASFSGPEQHTVHLPELTFLLSGRS